MIDIHCHFLPNIDDGCKTLEQSLELARLAVENGITHTIVTPHIHPGRYENTKSSIEKKFNEFSTALNEQSIPLKLGYAAEIRISPEIIPLVSKDEIPFLGHYQDKQVLLLEFPSQHIPLGADKLIQWLDDHKITALLAHPERNRAVAQNLDKLSPFIEMGCLLQVTAASVSGKFGERAEQCAQQLLEKNLVHVIASDAHNKAHRPPLLRAGRDAAAKIIGEQAAQKLVSENPMAIVASQFC